MTFFVYNAQMFDTMQGRDFTFSTMIIYLKRRHEFI